MAFSQGYLGEPVPEETFTHSFILIIIQPLSLLSSTKIHTILPVQFTCLTIFFAQPVSTSPLWSTSWSGALRLILHTFLYLISVFFLQHMPIPLQPVFAVVPRSYHLFLVSLNTLLGTLSFTLTSHIYLSILISVHSSAPHFLSWQARSHFHVAYYFTHSCCTASLF